ncbi:MAG: serine hydrolase domain-containing protein [Bryobacterales bacterium]|nr:beta-lactamase family protein [Bryobacteraceae bacterium]MDW8354610.1 serine hydrolase domain-containing protein [Bryobacterales bacterium]
MGCGRIAVLGCVALALCSGQPLPEPYDSYLRAEIQLNDLPGLAAAVVDRGRTLPGAYGVRDVSSGEPMTPATLVELASVSKPLTALAVARLQREGRLDLEQPVRDYLPEFRVDHADSDRITVRHLLEHTSGLVRADDYRVPCCGRPGEGDLTLALRELHPARPRYRPGERFRYANSNYVVLAALIERLAGRPFPQYMREEVFEPLGMRRTTLDPAQAAAWGLAAQHERAWAQFRVTPRPFSGWYGSSLVKAPVEDVAAWLSAFLKGVPEFGAAGSARAWLENRRRAPYQMGWYVHRDAEWLGGDLVLEHTGFIWGANTAVVVSPRRGLAAAVLINAGTTRAGPLARGLLARAAGFRGPPPQRASFSSQADNWAFVIAGSGMVLALLAAFYSWRAWRDWRTGRRRLEWRSSRLQQVRAALLVFMAATIVHLLADGVRPLSSLPSSLRLAIPLLGLATSAVLVLAALLGLAPRAVTRS